MNEIYNIRVGDLVWAPSREYPETSIVGVVYKTTQKYIYYAIMAKNKDNTGDPYMTKDNKVLKKRLYAAISRGHVKISYSGSLKKRRKVSLSENE